MFRNQSVNLHDFSMVPRADIPRSAFKVQSTHKTGFDAGLLIPVFVDEVLPGDSWNMHATMFARLATPIFPIMDNLHLDTFWFFVPHRLVWENWERMMGAQDNPTDSISFQVPTRQVTGGYSVGSLYDYMGLPIDPQIGASEDWSHSSLPLRAYNLIYNEWFRDQNLQNSVAVPIDDGPDGAVFNLLRRGKRHDYFTGCLPWPQKGGTTVPLPLGTSAPVLTMAGDNDIQTNPMRIRATASGTAPAAASTLTAAAGGSAGWIAGGGSQTPFYPSNLYADLSEATAATINQLRQAFQLQRLLERDARGGTRYTELLQAHFGVRNPDARLQRPEYLGGNSQMIAINPIAQTSQSDAAGTPQGTLAAFGNVVSRNGFSQSFTEHGTLMCLASVRADLTYQQGLRRMWSRSTRYDFYWPVFAMLGEQAVPNKEIYIQGTAADDVVFGYQERWAEYRYRPSMVTGLMRSNAVNSIDAWHLAQEFTSLPTLGSQFIQDSPPLERVLAVGAEAAGQQLIFDGFFDSRIVRAMPTYSVPGLIDHL